MLIVIVIIGILVTALLPRLTWAQAKARNTARKIDLNQLTTALNAYQVDYGKFPPSLDDLKGTYIKDVPQDAGSKKWCSSAPEWSYYYKTIWDNDNGFVLQAELEQEGVNAQANFWGDCADEGVTLEDCKWGACKDMENPKYVIIQ